MKNLPKTINIGIPIYPNCDPLDVVGAYEIFNTMGYFLPKGHAVNVKLVAASTATVKTFNGLKLTPDLDFDHCPQLYVLFVPGGDGGGVTAMMTDDAYQSFLKRQAKKAKWVTSVCTGAFLLASAKLLDGYEATTYWAVIECLKGFEKVRVVNGYPRYVVDRNRVTGGGISSGLDESLMLVELITGSRKIAEKVQLNIQYNPQPPYSDGDPGQASFSIYEPVHDGMKKGFIDVMCQAVKNVANKK